MKLKPMALSEEERALLADLLVLLINRRKKDGTYGGARTATICKSLKISESQLERLASNSENVDTYGWGGARAHCYVEEKEVRDRKRRRDAADRARKEIESFLKNGNVSVRKTSMRPAQHVWLDSVEFDLHSFADPNQSFRLHVGKPNVFVHLKSIAEVKVVLDAAYVFLTQLKTAGIALT